MRCWDDKKTRKQSSQVSEQIILVHESPFKKEQLTEIAERVAEPHIRTHSWWAEGQQQGRGEEEH